MNEIAVEYFAALLGASFALAGLGGLIGLFQTNESWLKNEVIAFTGLILVCVMLGVLALFPIAVSQTLERPIDIWRTCSAFLVAMGVLVLANVIPERIRGEFPFSHVPYPIIGLSIFAVFINLVNVFRNHEPMPYIWALFLFFIIAIDFFGMFLLSVAGRIIERQRVLETASPDSTEDKAEAEHVSVSTLNESEAGQGD